MQKSMALLSAVIGLFAANMYVGAQMYEHVEKPSPTNAVHVAAGTVAGPTGVIYFNTAPEENASPRTEGEPNHPKPDFDPGSAGKGSPDAVNKFVDGDPAQSHPKSESFESLPPEVNSIAP